MSLLSRFNRKTVLVVGTFRSGTNLMKQLLEEHCNAEVVFSKWFWKHGVPPTEIQRPVPDDVPIVVMTKDPVLLNASLYDFWQRRRPELNVGPTLSDFITAPFVVYDNTGGNTRPKYLYDSPTAYWNQYHYSWIHWDEVAKRRSFVRLEALHEDTDAVVRGLADKMQLSVTTPGLISLPKEPVQPSRDGGKTQAKTKPVREKPKPSEADIVEINRRAHPEIAKTLGYA